MGLENAKADIEQMIREIDAEQKKVTLFTSETNSTLLIVIY